MGMSKQILHPATKGVEIWHGGYIHISSGADFHVLNVLL